MKTINYKLVDGGANMLPIPAALRDQLINAVIAGDQPIDGIIFEAHESSAVSGPPEKVLFLMRDGLATPILPGDAICVIKDKPVVVHVEIFSLFTVGGQREVTDDNLIELRDYFKQFTNLKSVTMDFKTVGTSLSVDSISYDLDHG